MTRTIELGADDIEPVYIHTEYAVYSHERKKIATYAEIDDARSNCPFDGYVREAALFEYSETGDLVHGYDPGDNPTLKEWIPETPREPWPGAGAAHVEIDDAIAGNAIVVDLSPAPAERMIALWRALKRATDRPLVGRAPAHAETDWYRKLDRIVDMEVRVTENGATATVPLSGTAGDTENRRVDRIAVRATLATGDVVEYDGNLVVLNDLAGTPPTLAGVLLSRDAGDDLDVETLTGVLHAITFDPTNDAGFDSIETQTGDNLEEAHHAAARLLLDDDAATEAIIAYAINRHVGNLLPTGAGVNAFRKKPDEAVTVTLAERHPSPPAPA